MSPPSAVNFAGIDPPSANAGLVIRIASPACVAASAPSKNAACHFQSTESSKRALPPLARRLIPVWGEHPGPPSDRPGVLATGRRSGPNGFSSPRGGQYIHRQMKRAVRLFSRLLVPAAAAALFFTACARYQSPLRIGMDIWPPYGLFYLAQQKGFFADEGVEVKLFDFWAISDVRRAFETGKLDGVATTLVEVLMARDASPRDLRAVRLIDFSNGADVILARREIDSMQDLRGKRIGVEPASLNTYVLVRALEKAGMQPSDVVAVPKEPRTMCDELLAGQLDAVVTYPPESARVLADPRFHAVFSSRDIPGEIVDVLALDARVLRERPREVAAMLRALDRACDYLRENPEEALRVMADRAGMPLEEFSLALGSGIELVAPSEQGAYFGPDKKLQTVADNIARILRAAGLLSGRPGVADCVSLPP
ncbi:MAG: hypothetical protein FGM15_11430 [Chthoniobacterales bacterium]|nr:hypothetical protein [Chthoniobacterales bacterium]